MSEFVLKSDFFPSGDQPVAIAALTKGLEDGLQHQTLMGVTGSGKTFTMANVIQNVQKPTLILSHNKTLAAQLYAEFKHFFPDNAVHYFVSYFDYYQPEAYVPQRDLFIEKDSAINEHIEQMRLSATKSVLERRDVIVVASVSCIYGLGSPESAYITVLVSAGNTTVSIASPADGAVFSVPAPNNGVVGTAVPITATVTTASGAVLSKIEYFESTHSIGISSITSYAWTPLVPGIYTVTAKVTDSTGATGVSAPVIITVADASGETITFLHNDFAGSAIAATDAAGVSAGRWNSLHFSAI